MNVSGINDPPPRAHGFTLLELLVVLAVFALLLTVLAGALRLALGPVARQTASATALTEAGPVLTWLENTIGDARPIAQTKDGPILFQGTAAALTLVAPLGGAVTAPRIIRLGTDHGALFARWASVGGDPADQAAGSAILLPEAGSVTFRYLGSEGWRDDWLGRPRLPALVAVTIEGAHPARLTIAPRVTGTAALPSIDPPLYNPRP